jgi:hypothetical protein
MNPARRAILLVVLILALPFVLGFALYYFGWRPSSTGNYGELLQPPPRLPERGLLRPDGRELPASEFKGKWLLVLAGDGPCDPVCRQRLHDLRQVQVSLNKEMGRLRRVWLGDGTGRDPAMADLRRDYPDLLIAAPAPGAAGEGWRTALDASPPRIYIVDPLGNVILRYPDSPDIKGVRKDVERLLKYSWVG